MSDQNVKCQTHENLNFCKDMKISNQNYTICNKIGSGNFGQVFLGIKNNKITTNVNMGSAKSTANKMVAIKIEKQCPGKPPQLSNEINILKNIKSDKEGSVGFPEIYQYGVQKNSYYLIMELLGPNLNDLMKLCGGKFSLNTTIYLAMQIFQRIQLLHSKGYVCRDIKPQNFMMGIGKKSAILYMIDFGLSKPYMDQRINLHKPYRQQRDFSGTMRYASICSHLRIQHSRRDDLQSICYLLIYFMLGTLPWQNNRSDNMDMKQRLIVDKKIKISSAQLCAGLPVQFKNILEYCWDLNYYQEPDYQYIQSQLVQLHEKIDSRTFVYDWAMLEKGKILQKLDMTINIKTSQTAHLINDESGQSKSSYSSRPNNKASKFNKNSEIKWLGESQQSSPQVQSEISVVK